MKSGNSTDGRVARRLRWVLLAAAVLVLLLTLPTTEARADTPTVAMLEAALLADPHAPSAPLVLRRMARLGERGWKRLAKYAEETEDEGLRRESAIVLGDGTERVRLDLVARLYDRATTHPEIKAVLAASLARAYPRYAERLHAHLTASGPGALDVLRILGSRGIPREELQAAQSQQLLADLAGEFLQGRGPTPAVIEMLPRARELATDGLTHAGAQAFASAYAEEPYRPLLRALAELLREPHEPRRAGVHCLLLTVSGVEVAADADLWNAWIEAQGETYAPPEPLSRGAIAAAVVRGVRYLRRDLEADGSCRHGFSRITRSPVGCTALAVLALRSAGVSADDAVLRKAVETSLVVRDAKGNPGLPAIPAIRGTYCCALLAMAYQALGAREFKSLLPGLRSRLCEGMLVSGEWTYKLHSKTNPTTRATGDHSNTQYANLGLRALRACGAEIEPAIWERIAAHWRGNQDSHGSWGYRSYGRDRGFHRAYMTPGGLAGIAMALEARGGREASALIATDPAIRKGLWFLGRTCLRGKGLDGWTPYGLYALERGCVLCGVNAFSFGTQYFDWYREGAHALLRRQNADGSWGRGSVRSLQYTQGCGKAPDTAFALLFLTRATATVGEQATTRDIPVPFTAKEAAALPERPVALRTPGLPRPWVVASAVDPGGVTLRLASRQLRTNTGKAVVAGCVEGSVAELRVGDRRVVPDEVGWFRHAVELTESGDVEVVVIGEDGGERHARVRVELDQTPPEVSLVGPARRAAAVQRIQLEADECLDGVRIGRCYFPADGRLVTVTVELKAGQRKLPVVSYDLAGNRRHAKLGVEVENRVLVLDGSSAVRVSLPKKPRIFTLECWARLAAAVDGTLLSDAHGGGGGGLFLKSEEGIRPFAVLNPGGKFVWLGGPKPIPLRRWTHVAMTYDGEHLRLWVNGDLAAERAHPKYPQSASPLLIGGYRGGKEMGRHLVGAVDEVRLSDIVRYTEPFRPRPVHAPDRHTVALFHFDTDTGEAFADASRNDHTGKPAGTPQVERVRR